MIETNRAKPATRVAGAMPGDRPENMRATVEEILLRRRRGAPPSTTGRPRQVFPPPPPQRSLVAGITRRPGLAALGAYGVWMVGWAYYLWSLPGDH